MAFVSVTKPAVGEPTRKPLIDLMIDNEADLNARISSFAVSIVPNGSFELDADSDGIPDNWTRTLYSGGSSAINNANHASGDQCFSFTSTVLANGGGDLVQTDFAVVAGGKDYPVEVWIKGSVANISSKAEVNWYDSAQSFISSSIIANLTNTPTSFTNYGTFVSAPATARYAKIKLTGGVPGAGSATGTIYFDAVFMPDIPALGISNTMLAPAAVTWSKINTSLQQSTGSINSGAHGEVTFTGGGQTLGWALDLNTVGTSMGLEPSDDGAYVWKIGFGQSSGGSVTYRFQANYINSSPPWNMGDGDVPLFAFAEVRPDGTVARVDLADAPPWGYNGPTRVVPSRVSPDGRKFRAVRQLIAEYGTLAAARAAGLTRAQILDRLATDPVIEEEITHAVKNRDMPLIPHPFGAKQDAANAIVLLDPVSPLMLRLAAVHRDQSLDETLGALFLSGAFILGNTPLNRAAPPGVMIVSARWR